MAVFGLGLAALGRPGYMTLGHGADLPSTDEQAMARHCAAMCEAAFAAGIRHFDTARSYGLGERFLSQWLAASRPKGVVVSSKWGYAYTANWQRQARVHEVKEHSLEQLDRQWPESQAILDGWLSIYQIHSVTLESGVLGDEAVLGRLAQLRSQGVAVGLSVTGPRQGAAIRRALEIERDGRRLFDWVQATWNLLEPSAGEALDEAHRAGVKTIIKEPLANGRLSPRGDVPHFLAWANEQGASPDALALAVARSQRFADVVLLGAATLRHLESNLAAERLALSDEASHRATTFALAAERYWSERQSLAWS